MLTLTFNGTSITSQAATVAVLLHEQGIDLTRKGIAVARNAHILPRSAWEATAIAEGDTIDVVHAIAGG
jgi:sulfur carrier protein